MIFKVSSTKPPIIIVDGKGLELEFAAGELARYLGQVLGTDITVGLEKGQARSVPIISLDIVDDKSLTDEGYELAVSAEDEFHIRGGGPSGVVYGVYEFLRRYAGCRFSGPGAENEHVPRRTVLEIAPGKLRRTPRLWYRGMQFSQRTDEALVVPRIDWMAKNGLNYAMLLMRREDSSDGAPPVIDPETSVAIPQGPRDTSITMDYYRRILLPELQKRGLKIDVNHHNIFFWLPPARYFHAHPEWYALRNGKRVARHEQLAICTSNAEAMAELIKNVLEFLRENPEVAIVGVVPEDGYGVCECEECRKLDKPGEDIASRTNYRTPEGENRAKIRRYALMINQVARAVKAEFPDKYVGMAAYVDMAWPPRDVALEDNVIPWIATYWRCAGHSLSDDACPPNRFYHDLLKQWRAVFKGRLITYSYYMGMNAQLALPYPMGRTILGDWDELEKLGLDGATIQVVTGNFNAHGWNYLCFARRAWDADADADVILDEYLEGMFGPAGPALKPIWRALDDALRRVTNMGPKASGYVTPAPEKYVRPDGANIIYYWHFVRDVIPGCLERARNDCRNDRERRQVEVFSRVAGYWGLADAYFRKFIAAFLLEENNLPDEAGDLYPAAIVACDELVGYLERNLPGVGWVAQTDIKRYRNRLERWLPEKIKTG